MLASVGDLTGAAEAQRQRYSPEDPDTLEQIRNLKHGCCIVMLRYSILVWSILLYSLQMHYKYRHAQVQHTCVVRLALFTTNALQISSCSGTAYLCGQTCSIHKCITYIFSFLISGSSTRPTHSNFALIHSYSCSTTDSCVTMVFGLLVHISCCPGRRYILHLQGG